MSRTVKFAVWFLLAGVILVFSLSPIVAQKEKTPVEQDGPYGIGVQITKFTDETRDNRELKAYIWYPGLTPKGAKPPYAPDTTGAPYPLIIYSHGYSNDPTEAAGVFIQHLVSQGYVVAGVNHQDTDDVGLAMVNRPLDVLFLLDQLANLSEDNPLVGVINTDNVGVIGYSAGSYTSIVAGGARIDPASLPDWCATTNAKSGADYCNWVLPTWDQSIAYHDQLIPASTDNLWSAITDERIKAVGLIAPCFSHVIGEKGIADFDLPIILFSGTIDSICPPDVDANYYYQNLTAPDRYLVTLTGRSHGSAMDVIVLKSYVSAFFGLYLQDKTDYAQYLTPDSAAAFRSITVELQLAEKP